MTNLAMNLLSEELNNLINLLEADIPANPGSPKHQRRAKQLEREVRAYFKRIEGMIPMNKVEAIYNKYVKE